PYAKQRIQFGSPLSEKQGYTHKLVVPNVVRAEAAAAYVDEVVIRLDSGEEDLQVEGSIAKLFATESADKAADDAIQGLGGYGYIAEYEVEKIKRDVRITRIYEGTSEIQQNIIGTFRWKKTWKTKGEFYLSIYKEMDKLNASITDAGYRYYGLAAKALNDTITFVHENKLTRQQHIMFLLADMMAYVEVGASLARKSAFIIQSGGNQAEKFKIISRIFANETARLVLNNLDKILRGSGSFSPNQISDFMARISYDELMLSYENILADMDKLADIVFER
ncbi:MAG: acyl-CoA dehydrogenase, partial [Desulfobacterium sp.]|nr:acyl-CoA dehydrogenase [Desulfobacterium sp.]